MAQFLERSIPNPYFIFANLPRFHRYSEQPLRTPNRAFACPVNSPTRFHWFFQFSPLNGKTVIVRCASIINGNNNFGDTIPGYINLCCLNKRALFNSPYLFNALISSPTRMNPRPGIGRSSLVLNEAANGMVVLQPRLWFPT